MADDKAVSALIQAIEQYNLAKRNLAAYQTVRDVAEANRQEAQRLYREAELAVDAALLALKRTQ